MRNYIRKSNRCSTSSDVVLRAIRSVKVEGRSIRSVAKDFGIPFRSLSRYCTKVTEADVQDAGSDISIHVGYRKCKMIFTATQEKEIEAYLLKAADSYYELSPREVRKFAFQYAKALKCKIPESWRDKEIAGIDWFNSFIKRHYATDKFVNDNVENRLTTSDIVTKITSTETQNEVKINDNLGESNQHLLPEDIQSFQKTGQCKKTTNLKRRSTAILTDIPIKKALKQTSPVQPKKASVNRKDKRQLLDTQKETSNNSIKLKNKVNYNRKTGNMAATEHDNEKEEI